MEAPILIVPLVIFLFSTILPFYSGAGVESALILQEPVIIGGMNRSLFLLTLLGLLGSKFFHSENDTVFSLGKGFYVSYATIALLMLVQYMLMDNAPLFNGQAVPGSGLILGLLGVALSFGALIYLVGLPYIEAIRDELGK